MNKLLLTFLDEKHDKHKRKIALCYNKYNLNLFISFLKVKVSLKLGFDEYPQAFQNNVLPEKNLPICDYFFPNRCLDVLG